MKSTVALLALLCTAACGAPERTFELIDPAGVTSVEEIGAMVDATRELAPTDDTRDVELHTAFLRITVVPAKFVDGTERPTTSCFDGPCGFSQGNDITVAWRTCADGAPTIEILAHEIGHAIGHKDHAAAPEWFARGGVQDRAFEASCPH